MTEYLNAFGHGFQYILILLAVPIGVLVGLLPGLGALMTMVLLYPLLDSFDIYTIIIFYAVLVNAKEFSGSVSALNFNVLGEITSAPVLKERGIILKNGLQMAALRNTMLASLIGVFFGITILLFSIWHATQYPWLLRTEVMGLFLMAAVVFLIFWGNNKWWVNMLLMSAGFIAGMIGYNITASDDLFGRDFLTFGNIYLAGGLPYMSVVFGVYALPRIFELYNQFYIMRPKFQDRKASGLPWLPSLRGSMVGSLLGLVPFIGTMINSHFAYVLEKNFFSKKSNALSAMKRIASSESSNNAGQVTVLIPLFILGLAAQPSEVVLLDLIMNKQWTIANTLNLDFIWSLCLFLVFGCLITSMICYVFIKKTLNFFHRHINKVIYFLTAICVVAICFQGYKMDQTIYFFIVFLISACVGWIFKKIDTLPLIMILLLENTLNGIILRLFSLY